VRKSAASAAFSNVQTTGRDDMAAPRSGRTADCRRLFFPVGYFPRVNDFNIAPLHLGTSVNDF
jgi:hypothetical protein